MYVVTTAKINPRHLKPILEGYSDISIEYRKIGELREKLPQVEILITYGEDLTGEIVKECTGLKWLMVVSAGVDKLPFAELKAQNVIVTNVKGIHKIPMAEHACALMLQDSRQLIPIVEKQRQSIWEQSIRVRELAGKNLVIVGAGAIGEEIARKAKVFDMNTLGVTRSGRPVPHIDQIFKSQNLIDALSLADYVVVITPLTSETLDMFGEKEFKAMPDGCYFINIARGQVVQDGALVKALTKGWIRGAAVDTFREEPLPSNSPLWNIPNLIITPHIGGRTPKYMERAMDIFKYNFAVYYQGQGQMKNIVDLTKGY